MSNCLLYCDVSPVCPIVTCLLSLLTLCCRLALYKGLYMYVTYVSMIAVVVCCRIPAWKHFWLLICLGFYWPYSLVPTLKFLEIVSPLSSLDGISWGIPERTDSFTPTLIFTSPRSRWWPYFTCFWYAPYLFLVRLLVRTLLVKFCLLWINEAKATDKTYLWVSV
jgi:hypothetical protein